MIVFLVFLLVIVLWVMRSILIAATGPEWFIELNHGDSIPKVDKALKTIKTIGLVFIAFVSPAMFLAGTIAAALLYFGALREAVKAAENGYLLAERELQEEVSRKPKQEAEDTPSVP